MTFYLSPDEIKFAAGLLKEKHVVAFPTETVYGLGAHIFYREAIAKIFSVKGRPSDNPLIAHICDIKDLSRIAVDVPKDFYVLAEAFFPGPLTILLKRHPDVPSIVSAGLDTIAVRMPSHKIAQRLIELTGAPLVAPSANLSGKPSSTTAEHVLSDFNGKIAAVVDGGPCQFGIESTVIQLEPHLRILRPGAVTKEEIEKVLKKEVGQYVAKATSEEAVPSPGMKYRHYAPDVPIKLFYSKSSLEEHLSNFPLKRMVLSNEKGEYLAYPLKAHSLYASFRRAEKEHCQEIAIFCDPETVQNTALMNRVLRAALV